MLIRNVKKTHSMRGSFLINSIRVPLQKQKKIKIQSSFISNITPTFSKMTDQTNTYTAGSNQLTLDHNCNLDSSLTLFHHTQVVQVEQAINNFTESVRKILTLCPNLHVYNDILENKLDQVPEENAPALSRPNLKLGAELVSLHSLGKLDVLSTMLDIKQNFDKSSFSTKEPFLLSSSDYNDLVELDNERETKKNTYLPSDNFFKDPAETTSKIYELETSQAGFSEKKDEKDQKVAWPPKLPLIENPFIKARVFTHKSMVNDKTYLSKADLLQSHNERLEFLGDTVLNHTVTMMIYKKFPNMNEGELTNMRMELVKNERLKEWSLLYDFQNSLHAVLDSTHRGNNNQTDFQLGKQKIYADVFEAYIGGLMEEDSSKNLPLITEWLEALSAPVIDDLMKPKIDQCEENMDMNAKNTLYSIIGFSALNLHYVAVKIPSPLDPIAEVECRIRGEKVLGRGVGKNIKLAGMRAAQSVLYNKELIKDFANLRSINILEESESSL